MAPKPLIQASEIAWRLLAVAAAAAVVVLLIVKLRLVVIPFGIALLLAGILAPPASWLEDKGLPSSLATSIVFFGALAIGGLSIWFISARLAAELPAISDAVREGWESLIGLLEGSPLGGWLGEDPFGRLTRELQGNAGRIADRLLSGAATAIELATMLALTILFTFFLVKDGERLFTTFVRQFDHRGARRAAEDAGTAVWSTLSGYFRGLALIALVNALTKGLALWLIGVPLILVLMLITFVGSFIPLIGPILASLVGALVALTSGGLLDAGLVILAGIAIQQLEGNVLEPAVMGKVMSLHPIVVLAAVAAGTTLGGLPGAFFSVPVVATGAALYSQFTTGSE